MRETLGGLLRTLHARIAAHGIAPHHARATFRPAADPRVARLTA